MRVLTVGLFSFLMLAGCEQQQQQQQQGSQSDARQNVNSDRYNRDREACRGAADDYMRTRRNIDDSSREVVSGNYERYGQNLPSQMANYGDSRSSDKVIANCMESRGWPQPSKPWWQKIGS
ncbi:MAG TPA: hypothetical protein VK630_00205 [Reyranella sp.]|nr:hypothetical protein [Reyranella sp.]